MTDVVNSYYQAVENGSAATAKALICPQHRATWAKDQRGATADMRRGIISHTVSSTAKRGSAYLANVQVGRASGGSENVAVTVVEQNHDYLVCGGPGQ